MSFLFLLFIDECSHDVNCRRRQSETHNDATAMKSDTMQNLIEIP